MTYSVQPITDRTWIGTKPKIASQFSTTWSKTIAQLTKEIDLLGGRDFVIQMDIGAEDLKLNGELRANARPATAAVVVTFESKHGPLTYRCDRFYTNYYSDGPDWQHNVRAIALTLEALRSVDRYGATETGQQYTGFKALGAGRAMPSSHMTADDAYALIERVAVGDDLGPIRDRYLNTLRTDVDELRRAFKEARAVAHPDRGGKREIWDQLENAGRLLGLTR